MDRNTALYDAGLPDEERAQYLISRMTPEEKLHFFTLRMRNERLGLAAAIFGEANPAGRLPMTWYRSDAELQRFTDRKKRGRRDEGFRDGKKHGKRGRR